LFAAEKIKKSLTYLMRGHCINLGTYISLKIPANVKKNEQRIR